MMFIRKRLFFSILMLLFGLLMFKPAAAAQETISFLPIWSSSKSFDSFDQVLNDYLAKAKSPFKLHGPLAFHLHLYKNHQLAEAIKDIKDDIAKAERATLYLERAKAIRIIQKSIQQLEMLDAALFDPELLAKAHLTRALALFLKPADPAGAKIAFQTALAIFPNIRPDLIRLSPRAARLWQEALQEPIIIQSPTLSSFKQLATRSQSNHLLWISVQLRPSTAELMVMHYDHQHQQIRAHQRIQCTELNAQKKMIQFISEFIKQLSPSATDEVAHLSKVKLLSPHQSTVAFSDANPSVPQSSSLQLKQKKEWYKRWWIWTLAGAVIVGSGVIIGMALNQDSPPNQVYQFQLY